MRNPFGTTKNRAVNISSNLLIAGARGIARGLGTFITETSNVVKHMSAVADNGSKADESEQFYADANTQGINRWRVRLFAPFDPRQSNHIDWINEAFNNPSSEINDAIATRNSCGVAYRQTKSHKNHTALLSAEKALKDIQKKEATQESNQKIESHLQALFESSTAEKNSTQTKPHFGKGFLGIPFGLIAGSLRILLNIFTRLINNSVLSPEGLRASLYEWVHSKGTRGFVRDEKGNLLMRLRFLTKLKRSTWNLSCPDSEKDKERLQNKYIYRKDERPWHAKYIFGLPGILWEIFVWAPIEITAVATVRLIVNNIKNIGRGFILALNVSLYNSSSPENKIAGPWTNDSQTPFVKAVSTPGALLGIALGSPFSLSIALIRLVDKNVYSWMALSGGLMNVALGRQKFSALAADVRSAQRKALGGLGYFIATLTTGPVALLIGLVRSLVPHKNTAEKKAPEKIEKTPGTSRKVTQNNDGDEPAALSFQELFYGRVPKKNKSKVTVAPSATPQRRLSATSAR
ncbi:MAG: hypothetical protein DHS20C10_01120 [marine bacterium B5-7]|nr:MAG: hypothetical protein DHS20C10_01120 [marine bacterium B5-7]